MTTEPNAQITDLAAFDLHSLREQFLARRSDLNFLESLNAELRSRNSDEANALQFEVIRAKRQIAPAVKPATSATPRPSVSPGARQPPSHAAGRTSAPSIWIAPFLAQRGLRHPDGRALHRYRMTDDEFQALTAELKKAAAAGRFATASHFLAALFVPYCAEWFRRERRQTVLRWKDPLEKIGADIPYPIRRELTNRGISYWQRRVRQTGTENEFLLTLALEGGFPARILVDGTRRGWLKDYLRSILRRGMISARSAEETLDIAQSERERVRSTYQHEDFVALCAELAWKLMELRRKAETLGGGAIRNSTLLDIYHPGWREDLPVYVPAEDEALAAELLSGLLNERLTGLSNEGVEVKRYLLKRDGMWQPAVQLLADGEISLKWLPNLKTLGRIRAVPAGELANWLSGEAALLEPPGDEQQRYRVRPLTRASKLIVGFPLLSPVTVTLHAPDCAPAAWTWPHGEALRSDVLVFAQDTAPATGEKLLRYLRSGSVKSPEKELYVLVPEDWTVEGSSDDAIAGVEFLPAIGRKLIHIKEMTYFSAGDAERYRIEPHSSEQRAQLVFQRAPDPGFTLADDRWEVLASPARISIQEVGQAPREAQSKELWLRPAGGAWTPLAGPIEGSGLVELSWRDTLADIQIEKRRFALLPSSARLRGAMNKPTSGTIMLEGLAGWRATLHQGQCDWQEDSRLRISFTFSGRPSFRLQISLQPPAGPAFDVVLPIASRYPVVALADGSVPTTRIDVGALRGAFAMSPEPAKLQLAARGNKSSCITEKVDGELPLGILRSAIDEILATAADQDEDVELEFLGDSRPPIRICRYRHKQLWAVEDRVAFLPAGTQAAVIPVARMILDPRLEYALKREGESTWLIPESCRGLCLLYLRDGPDVVSRPTTIERHSAPEKYTGSLVSAATVRDFNSRQMAISSALSDLAVAESLDGSESWLLDVIANLNGLPASALDALKLLPSRPAALIRILLNARSASERAAVWALQNELPFLWLALPLQSWQMAVEKHVANIVRLFEPIHGASKATETALKNLRDAQNELNGLDTALAHPLRLAGVPMEQAIGPSLAELVNGHIRGQHQRDSATPNDIAEQISAKGIAIPQDILSKSHQDFAGLFAPLLLAASAQEKLVMTRDQSLLVRRTVREDPFYVAGAYGHLLSFQESN